VLAFSLLLASCGGKAGGDDTEDGTGIQTGNGITNGVIAQGLQVKYCDNSLDDFSFTSASLPNYTETKDFGYTEIDGAVALTDYIADISVKIINGKLNMTLGVPKDYNFNFRKNYQGLSIMKGLRGPYNTVTPSDVNLVCLAEGDLVDITGNYSLWCIKRLTYTAEGEEVEIAYLIYADKDVTIKGSYSGDYGDGYTNIYDCSFKKGWNYLIIKSDSGHTSNFTSSQTLPSGYYWILFGDW
jgi:hypothetical protein